ncbi:hypothetical protein L1887_53596 [Cichorium endivia]|nr:hypothetical protein L1887_53596 [Cichorium endivia]
MEFIRCICDACSTSTITTSLAEESSSGIAARPLLNRRRLFPPSHSRPSLAHARAGIKRARQAQGAAATHQARADQTAQQSPTSSPNLNPSLHVQARGSV